MFNQKVFHWKNPKKSAINQTFHSSEHLRPSKMLHMKQFFITKKQFITFNDFWFFCYLGSFPFSRYFDFLCFHVWVLWLFCSCEWSQCKLEVGKESYWIARMLIIDLKSFCVGKLHGIRKAIIQSINHIAISSNLYWIDLCVLLKFISSNQKLLPSFQAFFHCVSAIIELIIAQLYLLFWLVVLGWFMSWDLLRKYTKKVSSSCCKMINA